jgi:hypothetical protein
VVAWSKAAKWEATYRFTTDQLLHNIDSLEAIAESAANSSPVAIGMIDGT